MRKLQKFIVLSLTCIFAMGVCKPAFAFSEFEQSEAIISNIKNITELENDLSVSDKITITETDRNLESNLDILLSSQIKDKNSASLFNEANFTQSIANLEESDFTLLEVYEDDNEKILSYQVYNDRFILHYYHDGTILKTVTTFKEDEGFIYYENFENINTNTIDSINLPNINIQVPLDSDYSDDSMEINSSYQANLLASVKRVNPKPLNVSPSSAVLKYTISKSFPALKALGYGEYQYVRVYESSKNFRKTVNDNVTLINAKSHYDLAAAWWNISTTTAKGWLNAASVVMDTYGYLQEAIEPVREQEYTFSGGIETTVYDPITYRSEVEVTDDWGDGIYTLVFDRVYNGFANATWGISAFPYPFNTSYSTYTNNAQDIYNKNILMNGSWIHGRGQLGY